MRSSHVIRLGGILTVRLGGRRKGHLAEVFALFEEGPRIARLAADILDLPVRTARGTGPIAIVARIVPGKFRIQKQFRIVRRKRIITNALPREQQLHVIMSTGATPSFALVMEERDGYNNHDIGGTAAGLRRLAARSRGCDKVAFPLNSAAAKTTNIPTLCLQPLILLFVFGRTTK